MLSLQYFHGEKVDLLDLYIEYLAIHIRVDFVCLLHWYTEISLDSS